VAALASVNGPSSESRAMTQMRREQSFVGCQDLACNVLW
jgi:hypothetical protein